MNKYTYIYEARTWQDKRRGRERAAWREKAAVGVSGVNAGAAEAGAGAAAVN